MLTELLHWGKNYLAANIKLAPPSSEMIIVLAKLSESHRRTLSSWLDITLDRCQKAL